LVGHR